MAYTFRDLQDDLTRIDRGINDTIRKVTNRSYNDSLYTDGGVIDFSDLWNTPIEKYCMIEMADRQKLRLMSMSLLERNVTLAKLADSTSGVSNHVSDEVHMFDYDYTMGNNYLHEYQMNADKTTTQKTITSNNYQNYNQEGHNVVYGISMNAYYDDNDSGTDRFGPSRKIEYYDANRNRNSILSKTKQLFVDRKINTIISRFHTDNEKMNHNDTSESARSVYGLSHGRNLLTYDAERNSISYDTNGYNNPYCRVWTHHHQYSEQRSRLMRPFYTEYDEGFTETKKNEDLHKWNGFDDVKYTIGHYFNENAFGDKNIPTKETENGYELTDLIVTGTKKEIKSDPWSWKNKGSEGWKHSVLNNETGLLNITPKFLGGAKKNIHTKDCMFSIENLAWQGYDPYSFERALSWEQRGPFGGRIMWFPPYGLQFSEESSVNWNEHSFIGRGENVFTYANTSRSGTLSFMMLVDHPSILDYATWHDPKDLKDTDVFRFFAGCDSTGGTGETGNGSSNGILQGFTKPTPLTDEYLEADKGPAPIDVTENKKPETPSPKEEEKPPTPDEEIEIQFYTFFPNNYSGAFDRVGNTNATIKQNIGVVDPIAYLLYGKGAQWYSDENNITNSKCLPISFDGINKGDTTGLGYEMKSSKMDKNVNGDNNYIVGTNYYKDNSTDKTYHPNKQEKWYYRIDGEYKAPIIYNEVKNTFAQKISPADRRTVTGPNNLNFDSKSVINCFGLKGNDAERIYSLAEVAYVLAKDEAVKNKIIENINKDETFDKHINQLSEYFDKEKYSITSIKCKGFSNSHGDNTSKTINEKRNDFLALNRRTTVVSWFRKYYGEEINLVGGEMTYEDFYNEKVQKDNYIESGVQVTQHNENALDAKQYRSAITTLTIKKSKTATTSDLNQQQSHEDENAVIYWPLDKGEPPIGFVAEYTLISEDPIAIANYKQKITKVEYDVLKPNEKNLYKLTSYSKTVRNILAYDEIIASVTPEYYEPYMYVLKGCEEHPTSQECTGLEKYNIKTIINVKEYDELPDATKGLYIVYQYKIKQENKTEDNAKSEDGYVRFTGWEEVNIPGMPFPLYKNSNETDTEKKNLLWYYDASTRQMKVFNPDKRPIRRSNEGWDSDFGIDKGINYKNSLRYDQEYYFFKQLKETHPDVFSSVVEKVQYFDPAFHSMSPEGFMGRLNFLHQCTRQGNTIANSDKNGFMANNLAFGRPPFCILRLGDFYYQKIVIRNISINYDPLVLDLNNEGIGVIPLIANVTITFNFIGGGDLTGPVRRLQNAMAFNYYANGRLYDNRADRVERKGTNNWDTMDMSEVDFEKSYFHDVKMKKLN